MTGDYVSLYTHATSENHDLLPFLSMMFLFMGRMLPIIALVPFFGGRVLPRPVKVTFALSLFAIFLPQLMTLTKTPLTFNLQLVLFFAKEIFIGVLIGFFFKYSFCDCAKCWDFN